MAQITKMLGIAISDCDAGRITKSQLLEIFQAAIDNGDILEEANRPYAVAAVMPLVDAGVLRRSAHLSTFDSSMNALLRKRVAELRAERAQEKSSVWWKFWK